ncbi:MAG: hypothetical protein RIA09_03455 [Hoeflea sp.]|uniref:DUF2946 family protein n=1 Tax=Hoeflea sp. TaxID=1940281 RepID=UPI0032EE398B
MNTGIGRSGWLRLLCALSLLLVAFAHKPIGVPEKIAAYGETDVVAFVLPDGSLPDICLTGGDGEEHHDAFAGCEACRLVASAGLPPAPNDIAIICALSSERQAFSETAPIIAQVLRHGAAPRAPPPAFG